MKFITLDEVLAIHDRMISIGGGRGEIHDFTLLHSAIERPKAQFDGKYLYSDLWIMAAAMMQSLVKNHPFDDGNKRTAFFTTLRFIEKNGYVGHFKKPDVLDFMVGVDVKNKSVEEIATWLKKNCKKIKALSRSNNV